MTSRQQQIAQALLRASDFNASHATDFNHNPPTKVDQKFSAARQRIDAAITQLGGKQAIQSGGAFEEKTESQREHRRHLRDELRRTIRGANSIAAETKSDALLDRFRMPDGRADGDLVASARAFARSIRELSLNDEFEGLGFGADHAKALETAALALEASEGDQGAALGEQAGATATIPQIIDDGKDALHTLDVLFGNVYSSRPEVLAAWTTASHIERQNGKKAGDKPAEGGNTPAPTPA
jgi:hypothetical protein